MEEAVVEADDRLAEAVSAFSCCDDRRSRARIMDRLYEGRMHLVAMYADSHRCFQGVGHRSPKADECCKPLSDARIQYCESEPHVVGLPAIKRAMWGQSTSKEEYLAVEGQLARMLFYSHGNLVQTLATLECWICVMDHLVEWEGIRQLPTFHVAIETTLRGALESARAGAAFTCDDGSEEIEVDEMTWLTAKLSVDGDLLMRVLESCVMTRELIGPGAMRLDVSERVDGM